MKKTSNNKSKLTEFGQKAVIPCTVEQPSHTPTVAEISRTAKSTAELRR